VQAVILAAGRGSRLGDIDYPKALSLLSNGETILGRQVRMLKEQIPQKRLLINIVVGFERYRVMEQFKDHYFVINDLYKIENTAKSLCRALDTFRTDVIWLNGDVVCHPDALQAVIDSNKTCMLVNRGPVGEEEVKYKLGTDGAIVSVSKTVENAEGEALGINFFKVEDAVKLKAALEECERSDYFEKGIEKCIKEGMKVWPVYAEADQCVEVDFPEDLMRANDLINKWG
jgi:choline kinase